MVVEVIRLGTFHDYLTANGVGWGGASDCMSTESQGAVSVAQTLTRTHFRRSQISHEPDRDPLQLLLELRPLHHGHTH